MSEVLAAAYALFVICASVAIYIKLINKPLDKMLDRAFTDWHKEIEEVEEF